MLKWWNHLSVVKKLYTVVGIMVLLVTLELVTLKFVMNQLSSVRAFVGGEGLWSKAQKSAVNGLQKYALTRDPIFLKEYEEYLKIPLGDRQARTQLESADPDLQKVFEGFKQGGVHENDIPGLIKIIRRFHDISYIREALEVWRAADGKMVELVAVGSDMTLLIQSKKTAGPELQFLLDKIYLLDKELTVLENRFSYVLGEGSRWLEGLLMSVLICIVLTVEGFGLFLTITFSRTLSRSLKEMNEAATEVGQGRFGNSIPVRSKDEIGQLAAAINKMTSDLKRIIGQKERAESANKVKTIFLANMSHEIRTPLGIILGLTEVLREGKAAPEETQKYLDIIDRTGRHLSKVINDILDISKVESGYLEVDKTKFSLPEFLENLHQMLSADTKSANTEIRFVAGGKVPEHIETDRSRLRQILLNLLNNALKFTERGTVTMTYWIEASGKMRFQVADTGIGMNEEQKSHIFNLFYQADLTTTRKYEGTGLGLALSKRLAKNLGGDVELVKSKEGEGSTFVVSIPVGVEKPPVKEAASPVKEQGRFLNGKKILVVEDNKDNQLLMNLFLQKNGAIVECADNGEEGVSRALAFDYDLVLMDVQMPILDGYEATQRLRAKGYGRPIIAVTAHAMKEEREKCIEAGCNDYLSKPISSSVLYSTVAKYLDV